MINECRRVDFLNYTEDRLAHNYINITPSERKDNFGASYILFELQKQILIILLVAASVVVLAFDNKAAAHGIVLWADPENPANCISTQHQNMDPCCLEPKLVHPNNINPQNQRIVKNEAGRRVVTILLPEPSLVEPRGDAIDPAQARDILIQDTLRRELNLGRSIDR